MCCRKWFSLAALVVVFPGISLAQSSRQVDDIRSAIKLLEERVRQFEAAETPTNNRVARIGEAPERVREPEEKMVIQLYDLSDLFAVTPTYPAAISGDLVEARRNLFGDRSSSGKAAGASGLTGGFGGGGFGGGGGGAFNVADDPFAEPGDGWQVDPVNHLAAAKTSLDDLMSAIQRTISPDEWDDAGGAGAIERLGNSLLISATTNTHRQITELLTLFRKRWGTLRTVSTRAHWLWLTQPQLETLLVTPPKRDPERPAIATEPFGMVNSAQWKKVAQRQEPFADMPAGYTAAITCYHGQTVHTVAGNQQLIVSNLLPFAGASGSRNPIGYQPRVKVLQEGAALQITPLTSTNAKYVVLDIHSRIQRLRNQPARAMPQEHKEGAATSAEEVVLALDRPVVMAHSLSTTLRVPVDQVMLVGGMTADIHAESGEPQLYLFVSSSVQELRDDPLDGEEGSGRPISVSGGR
jgi:hypothetical protein